MSIFIVNFYDKVLFLFFSLWFVISFKKLGTLAVLCDYSNMNGASADVLANLYGSVLIKDRTQQLSEERKRRAIETVKRLIQHAEEVFPVSRMFC